MAGHSQYANIKHRKDAQDAKRAKIFVKIAKEINVAVKSHGPNIETNSALRLALEKARANNMPKDNYEKIVKKASGELASENYEEVRYEGYGANGVAFIVDCLTDNRNRTAANVRSYFNKKGGSLAQTNAVAHMFNRKGTIVFTNDKLTESEVFEWLLEVEVEDLSVMGHTFIITTASDQLMNVKRFLAETKQIKDFEVVELTMIPSSYIQLTDTEAIRKIKDLINSLEEDDDVQMVYHNAEWDIEE